MRLAETSGGRHRRIHHKLDTGLSRLLLEHGAMHESQILQEHSKRWRFVGRMVVDLVAVEERTGSF
jgi:hypothetical protein